MNTAHKLCLLTILLAGCGGAIEVIVTPPPPADTYAEAGAATDSAVAPDSSAVDAGASDSPHDAADSSVTPDSGDAGRYVITGNEAYDRTTGLTWYRRFIYGSKSLNNSAICDFAEVDGGHGGNFRRATVAEGLTILVFPVLSYEEGGQTVWDYPFYWADTIPSEAADGCINLPQFSTSAECEGDLINNLCVRGP